MVSKFPKITWEIGPPIQHPVQPGPIWPDPQITKPCIEDIYLINYDVLDRTQIDNPGHFSNVVGDDLYINPWLALRRSLTGMAAKLRNSMNHAFGTPDLWFDGNFHRLFWGPRNLLTSWRPSFWAHISGHDGQLYLKFWLPWRGQTNHQGNLQNCNLRADKVTDFDVDMVDRYRVIADTLAQHP